MLLTQQTCVPMTSFLTPFPPVGIKLAVGLLAGVDDVLILELKALHEQLHIDVIKELKKKALGSDVVRTNAQMALRRVNAGGYVDAGHASVSLSAVQRIDDGEEGASEKDESFKEPLLVKRPAIAVEPVHDHMLRIEVLTEYLEWAAQEGVPLGLQ